MLWQKTIGSKGGAPDPVSYLNGISLTNQTSNATRTLTLNSGFGSGDLLLAMTGNRSTTAPLLLSGYTNILSINNSSARSLRLQFKLATGTSETITYNGAYGYLVAFRNFTSIGQSNIINTNGSGSVNLPVPDLTGLSTSGRGFIVAGSYAQIVYTSTTSPYSLFGTFGLSVVQNTASSITGATYDSSGSVTVVSYAVEIL